MIELDLHEVQAWFKYNFLNRGKAKTVILCAAILRTFQFRRLRRCFCSG
jgi:hypothetical protein